MAHPTLRLLLQSCLFFCTPFELPFETPHPGKHGVNILEDIVWIGVRVEGCICGVTQGGLDSCALLLDVEMGDLEILAEEFEGQAEKRLILWGRLAGGGGGCWGIYWLRTRRRFESGLSFEVMWSAIVSKVHPGIGGPDGEHEQSLSHRRGEGGGFTVSLNGLRVALQTRLEGIGQQIQ